jgi:IS30 family transposase
VYRGNHAQKRTTERRTVSKAPSQKIANDHQLRTYIIRKLKKHWSPEQIAGRLKQTNGESTIAHETVPTCAKTNATVQK